VGGAVPTVADTHCPAHVLGLDTTSNHAWQWRYRAVALDSDEGRSLCQLGDAGPAKRRVTLVHHAETIHKLKPSTPLQQCLCFDPRLPVSEQQRLRDWQAVRATESTHNLKHNPCPFFDSSLIDPPVTAKGLHGYVRVTWDWVCLASFFQQFCISRASSSGGQRGLEGRVACVSRPKSPKMLVLRRAFFSIVIRVRLVFLVCFAIASASCLFGAFRALVCIVSSNQWHDFLGESKG
jgi:hypothetical protein